MKRVVSRLVMGAALLAVIPVASFAGEHDHHMAAAAAADTLSEGTVKKIDKAGGKVTLAHGPIANLGMDGMTMAFKVKAPKQLSGLKVGDKVRFLADYVGGEIVIAHIEAAK